MKKKVKSPSNNCCSKKNINDSQQTDNSDDNNIRYDIIKAANNNWTVNE